MDTSLAKSWPICEGLVVTCDESGRPHLAPMGPFVSPDSQQLVFRPFHTSHTYKHLNRDRRGVFHITDDVELLARAAVGKLAQPPQFEQTHSGKSWYLPGACRWLEFEIKSIDDSAPRSWMEARVVDSASLRDFFGFNRAKHAVVEAAILATRVGLLDTAEIRSELERLEPWVTKTGGPAEHRAFQFLTAYIEEASRDSAQESPPKPDHLPVT